VGTRKRPVLQAIQNVSTSARAKNRSCMPGSRNGRIAADSAAAASNSSRLKQRK
jgi:hypothetical protein